MKKFIGIIAFTMLLVSCNSTKKEDDQSTKATQEPVVQEVAYTSFGDQVEAVGVLSTNEMTEKFKSIQPGDSIAVKFTAKVNEVCQSKGCWMRLAMGEDEAMVRFKDYGFFMPKDLAGEEVIVEGMAFVEEMSVDEQRHYAEDAGKTPEEIAAITEPKRTLSLTSSGVLVPEKQ